MTPTIPRTARTLAVHPVTRGFGWAVFEGPLTPYDWGFVLTKGDKNSLCLQKVEEIVSQHMPDTLVLEAFEQRQSSRSDRMALLGRGLLALAANRGVEGAVYTKQDVRACFQSVGARTRQQIAEAIVRHLDVLRSKLPKKRRPWDGEDHRMSLFSAVALILTHYQFGANRLFDDLTEQAQSDQGQ